jgi:hypothetical protein
MLQVQIADFETVFNAFTDVSFLLGPDLAASHTK